MASCTHCHYKWKAKNVWLLGFSKKGKACPNCQTKQFVSFNESGFLMGLGYLSSTVAIILIIFFPYFIKLSNKDETIF